MPRGGARPGSGRKPTRPKPETAVAEVDKDGFKTDPTWPFGRQRLEEPAPPPAKPDLSALTPLDYLLQVMRDGEEDKARRMQAASLAAPYVHAKKGEGGKKEQRNEAAKNVVSRFASAAPPKLVANAGKKV
jgi:phage terminase small subunit